MHHTSTSATRDSGDEEIDTLVQTTIAGGGVLPFTDKTVMAGKAAVSKEAGGGHEQLRCFSVV